MFHFQQDHSFNSYWMIVMAYISQSDLAQVPSRLEKDARTPSIKTEKKGKEAATSAATEIPAVSSQPAQSIEGKRSDLARKNYYY